MSNPVKHLKRNKRGHNFQWDGKGKPPEIDQMGIAQVCECGLRLWDWNCKWLWS